MGPKTVQEGPRLWSVSVWLVCSSEGCLSLPSVWVVQCLLWCQSPSGVDVGLCRCRLWPASMCLKVGERRTGTERGGTKCSSVPKTPLALQVSSWLLCTNAEMRHISVLHRRVGWEVSCSLSFCVSGTLCVTVAAEW